MKERAKKHRSYMRFSQRLVDLARQAGTLELRSFGEIAHRGKIHPLWVVESPSGRGKKTVCLSAGIHGDEPAGVEAVLQWMAELGKDKALLEGFQFTLFPCINPVGYEHDMRQNGSRIDLNREFDKDAPQSEIRLLKAAVAGRRFDFSYECHEDVDAPGYYLYEMSRNGRKGIGREIIRDVQSICPIHTAEIIEEMPARMGYIHASDMLPAVFWERIKRRGGWPQTVYFSENGTGICITAETPTRLEMARRVRAHLAAIETALNLI
ncbi:MAG: M14 family metallocarboxypeptidase [Nitrospiria bacterium]